MVRMDHKDRKHNFSLGRTDCNTERKVLMAEPIPLVHRDRKVRMVHKENKDHQDRMMMSDLHRDHKMHKVHMGHKAHMVKVHKDHRDHKDYTKYTANMADMNQGCMALDLYNIHLRMEYKVHKVRKKLVGKTYFNI